MILFRTHTWVLGNGLLSHYFLSSSSNSPRWLFIFLFIFYFFYFFLNYYLLIYFIFLAVLGPRFCVRASSSCGKRGPLFIAVRGPLTIAASLVA